MHTYRMVCKANFFRSVPVCCGVIAKNRGLAPKGFIRENNEAKTGKYNPNISAKLRKLIIKKKRPPE